jgi:hypothetical protein
LKLEPSALPCPNPVMLLIISHQPEARSRQSESPEGACQSHRAALTGNA